MATSKLQVILEAKDKASKVIKGFGDNVKGAETKVGGLSGKLGKLKEGFGTMQAAAAAAGLVTVVKVTAELVKLGLQLDRAETALIAMAGGAEEAEDTLEAVSRAAGGGIDNLTAMLNATRMLSMGLASNADEAGKLTDIAVTLGATMGKGPTAAMEEFALLLANQSILRLDTFGISGARVRERMNEMAQETKGLSRETRFLNAVMEEADGKMTSLEEAGFEAVSSVDVLSASFVNAKQKLASWLAEGLVPWIDIVVKSKQVLIDHEMVVRNSASSYAEYATEMERATTIPGTLRNQVEILTEVQWDLNEAVEQGRNTIDGWAAGLLATETAAGQAAEKVSQLVVATQELTTARIGQEAMQQLNQALKDGVLSQDQYDDAARHVMHTFTDLDPAAIMANFAIRDASAAFAEGTTDVEGYLAELREINRSLGDMPKITEVDVIVNYRTTGEMPGFQHGGSMMVGGYGGPDSQVVAFKASPGERVDVTPSNQTLNFAPTINNARMKEGALMDEFVREVRRL